MASDIHYGDEAFGHHWWVSLVNLPNVESRTGLSFGIDNNFLDDPSTDAASLRELHDGGWINLCMIDTTLVEHDDLTDQAKRLELEEAIQRYVIHLGPMVLDHSSNDLCVGASEVDDNRIDRVLAVLKPGIADREAAKPNDLRDAMHIATSIRYGENGFITNDKLVLRKSEAIRAAFNGFVICNPARGLATAQRFVTRTQRRSV